MGRGLIKGLGLVLLLCWPVLPLHAQALLPNAEQTFVDGNGVPLDGGTVTFYIPNTSTPKTTWSDQGESIPNTNPVVLDSAGRAIIWGTGSYRELVKDQFGNTIWDQVTYGWPIPSSTLPTFTILSTGTVATYDTPTGALELIVEEVGGGGGGGSSSNSAPSPAGGASGGATTFNGVAANGGSGGAGGTTDSGGNSAPGGQGGTGGSGSAFFRSPGNPGVSTVTSFRVGAGGGSLLGGGSGIVDGMGNGVPAQANSGGGGPSGIGATSFVAGGGGGGGEYAKIIINNPVATYTYTVGAGGAGGVGTQNGGAGGSGVILVEVLYN